MAPKCLDTECNSSIRQADFLHLCSCSILPRPLSPAAFVLACQHWNRSDRRARGKGPFSLAPVHVMSDCEYGALGLRRAGPCRRRDARYLKVTRAFSAGYSSTNGLCGPIAPKVTASAGDVRLHGAAREALRERVWHAMAGKERWRVVDVEMQVRLFGAAAVAYAAEEVAGMHRLPDLHRHSARPHVRVERIAVRRDPDDNVIAAGVVEADRFGVGSGVRDILRQPSVRRRPSRRRRCRSADRSRSSSVSCPRGLSRSRAYRRRNEPAPSRSRSAGRSRRARQARGSPGDGRHPCCC